MQDSFARLLEDIRACRVCAEHLPLGPRPVIQTDPAARLRIIGQAPGLKVHKSGVPWDDASGKRLRDWLGLTPAQFYNPTKVAIMSMGFCYPGKAASGDLPPRPECAPHWHDRLSVALPNIGLTLLIGQYAQSHYLAGQTKATLSETVQSWRDYFPAGWLPLPHPSPRNQPWLAKNPWFEAELIPEVRATVQGFCL